jgi:hypothetical protein
VLPVLNAATGSGPILWRLLYCAPIAVLVGLVAAAPVPSAAALAAGVRRLVPVGAAAALVVGLVLGGRPIWAYTGHNGPVTVSETPQWKLDVVALKDVRILADQGISGTVLMPPRWMKVLTMYTTDAFPVVPREWFIRNIQEPDSHQKARRVLFRLASGKPPLPVERRSVEALRLLDVDLACTGNSPTRARVLEIYAAAGYTQTRDVGTLECARQPRG